mmetsp:Transcript_4257/g.4006  ORF Transcript_4257/g.4006 Transcript_4257/m.4006 type:complete len:234 (-) Transcript_4257:28-729(-)
MEDLYLVKGEDISRLNFVFEISRNLFKKIINSNLIIFNSASHDQFEDSISNWLLLELSLPQKTIHFDSQDLSSKRIKVLFSFPWLNFEKNDRLGNWCSLLLLFLIFLGLLGNLFLGSSIIFIFSKHVVKVVVFIIIFFLLDFFLLLFLLSLLVFLSAFTLWSSPGASDFFSEHLYNEEPSEYVRESGWWFRSVESFQVVVVFLTWIISSEEVRTFKFSFPLLECCFSDCHNFY